MREYKIKHWYNRTTRNSLKSQYRAKERMSKPSGAGSQGQEKISRGRLAVRVVRERVDALTDDIHQGVAALEGGSLYDPLGGARMKEPDAPNI